MSSFEEKYVYLHCEGCGNIIRETIRTSHQIVSSSAHAPTGQILKEYCPIWLIEKGKLGGLKWNKLL